MTPGIEYHVLSGLWKVSSGASVAAGVWDLGSKIQAVLDNTALSEKQKQDEIFEVLNQKLVEYEATIAEQKVRYETIIDERNVHIRHLEDKNTYQKGAIDALEKRTNTHDQTMKAAITDLKSIFHNAQINASNVAPFGANASNAAYNATDNNALTNVNPTIAQRLKWQQGRIAGKSKVDDQTLPQSGQRRKGAGRSRDSKGVITGLLDVMT
jgi:uncharacterized coiled-coil protein SlyX